MGLFPPELIQQAKIKVPEELVVAVGIHIRQVGFAGGAADAHVAHVTGGAAKTVTDIPDRIGRREMAEKHADQMRPAVDAFAMLV